MKQKLFTYAILWHPTKEEAEKGKKSEILVQPATILADSDKSAAIMVSRKIDEKYLTQLDQVEIIIKPF
jgi:hypothetical protein